MHAGTAGLLFLQINPNLHGTESDKPVWLTVKTESELLGEETVFLATFVLGMVTVWCPEKFDSVAIIQEQIFELLSSQCFLAFTDKLVDSLDIFGWKGSLLSLFLKM